MKCDDIVRRLSDLQDGLLPPAEAAAVDEHLAACASCAERARDLATVRDVLYRPEEIEPPPDDLPVRILAAARQPRRMPGLVRYAAAFLAGVAVTLALTPSRAGPPEPGPADPPARVESPQENLNPDARTRSARVPRRIR